MGGVYAYTVYEGPGTGHFSERIIMGIGGAIKNSTVDIPATYYPDNFSVPKGATVILVVSNNDNITHGLAVPKFKVDTGVIKPNATVTISFTVNAGGNYTYDEPSADCGGSNCDAGQAMTGWFVVDG